MAHTTAALRKVTVLRLVPCWGRNPGGSPLTRQPEEDNCVALSCCKKSLSCTRLHYEHSLNIQLHGKSSGRPYTLIFMTPGLTHLVNSHVVGDLGVTQDQTSGRGSLLPVKLDCGSHVL